MNLLGMTDKSIKKKLKKIPLILYLILTVNYFYPLFHPLYLLVSEDSLISMNYGRKLRDNVGHRVE